MPPYRSVPSLNRHGKENEGDGEPERGKEREGGKERKRPAGHSGGHRRAADEVVCGRGQTGERKREREGGKEREGRPWLLRTEEGPQKALALCLVETRESRPCFNQTQGEGHPRASAVLWRPPPAKANSPSPSLPLFSSLQFALFRTPPSSTTLRWPPLWPASTSFSLPPLSLFSFLQFSLALQGPSRPSDGHHRLSSPSPPSLPLSLFLTPIHPLPCTTVIHGPPVATTPSVHLQQPPTTSATFLAPSLPLSLFSPLSFSLPFSPVSCFEC